MIGYLGEVVERANLIIYYLPRDPRERVRTIQDVCYVQDPLEVACLRVFRFLLEPHRALGRESARTVVSLANESKLLMAGYREPWWEFVGLEVDSSEENEECRSIVGW